MSSSPGFSSAQSRNQVPTKTELLLPVELTALLLELELELELVAALELLPASILEELDISLLLLTLAELDESLALLELTGSDDSTELEELETGLALLTTLELLLWSDPLDDPQATNKNCTNDMTMILLFMDTNSLF